MPVGFTETGNRGGSPLRRIACNSHSAVTSAPNGTQCQSPALHTRDYCFFHTRLVQRHSGFRHTAETRGYLIPGQHIELAPLEDRDSIQVALSVVINALATGQLDTRRATAILYGLQLASNNAARLHTEPFPGDIVRSAEQTPDGLELAEPGATGHILSPQEILDEAKLEAWEEAQEDQEQENQEQEDQEQEEQEQAQQEIRKANHEAPEEEDSALSPEAGRRLC